MKSQGFILPKDFKFTSVSELPLSEIQKRIFKPKTTFNYIFKDVPQKSYENKVDSVEKIH